VVEAFLEANPGVKRQIDDVSAQVNALLEEYESLKMKPQIDADERR
jgi:hypothetical protein